MPMLAPKQGTEWIGRRLKLRDLRILAPLPQRTDLRRWLSHASRPRHLLALGIARHHTRRAGANLRREQPDHGNHDAGFGDETILLLEEGCFEVRASRNSVGLAKIAKPTGSKPVKVNS